MLHGKSTKRRLGQKPSAKLEVETVLVSLGISWVFILFRFVFGGGGRSVFFLNNLSLLSLLIVSGSVFHSVV